MEPFRGKRLVVAEELKHTMTLDVGTIKSLTGGTSATVEDRKIGVGEQFKFVWQAGFLLIFNEGDCPAFDAADAAFTERMIVVPMRAKFVDVADVAVAAIGDEEYTYPLNLDMGATFPEWRSALMDIFIEQFRDDEALAGANIPASMRSWRGNIVDTRNPVADWMDRVLVVTGDQADASSMALLHEAALRDKVAVPKMKFFGFAKAYLLARGCTINPKGERVAFEGTRASIVANVVRGVRIVAPHV